EWNIQSLDTSIKNKGQEDPTPIDDHMTDSEPTEVQSEPTEVAETGNDMQIDGSSVKSEERINNAGAPVTPQIPIKGSVDELSAAYKDEKPAADSMAVTETTFPNTSPDSTSPEKGTEENDSFTLVKRA
ncbi:20937_t:CDS:1, partial [Gigaspora rosea]